MDKEWKIANPVSYSFINKFSDISPAVVQILFNRNIKSKEDIESFLRSDWKEDVHSPFLFKDMEKALGVINKHIKNRGRIIVFGDYDADGICGSAIIYLTLKHIGAEDVDVYIPHREFEGYGLNKQAIESLLQEKVDLVITVDLGISNIDEIKYLSDNGVETIIIDHHTIQKDDSLKHLLPDSDAIIHAGVDDETYPYKYLSGTGTAFKVAQALLKDSGKDENESFAKWLLDLTAIGTIADMVPLTGENRVLVKYGLKVLNKTRRLGLRMMIEKSGIINQDDIDPQKNFNLNSWNVSFQIAPRLNAAGRVNHAREALELILSDDGRHAYDLARHLNDVNRERQQMTDKVYSEALELIGETENKKFLFAKSDSWPIGVLGLVAGKIANSLNKPVILLTEFQGKYHGSGRSVDGLDITEVLGHFDKYLESYGGHSGACGLSVKKEDVDIFAEKMSNFLEEKLKDVVLRPVINVDVVIDFIKIDDRLVEEIEKLEPFGQGNPEPIFMTKNAVVERIDSVGSNGKHIRVFLKQKDVSRKFIGFNIKDSFEALNIKEGDRVDVLYTVGFNIWRGNREIQLTIKDIKK